MYNLCCFIRLRFFVNYFSRADVEFLPQADEQVMAPDEMSIEKLSIPLPSQAIDTNGVESNQELAVAQETLTNGETELEQHVKKSNDSAPGPMVPDEVENAINEQEVKYWNAVKENPQDFTSWTYLLQFVEQEVGKRVH